MHVIISTDGVLSRERYSNWSLIVTEYTPHQADNVFNAREVSCKRVVTCTDRTVGFSGE